MGSYGVECDPDIEFRFFIKVPYDPYDPDYTWYETFINSDDEEEDAVETMLKVDRHRPGRLRKVCRCSYDAVIDNDIYHSCSSDESITNESRTRDILAENHFNRSYAPAVRKLYIRGHILPTDYNEYISDTIRKDVENLREHILTTDYNKCISDPIKNDVVNLREHILTTDHSKYISDPIKKEVLPVYRGFQLIGDSQLLRFSRQLLSYKEQISTSTSGVTNRSLGYCISGQKIRELKKRLARKEYLIGNKVILLIGTNDFLYATSLNKMRELYKDVVYILKDAVEQLILLTVPPLPRLRGNAEHWIKLKSFNDYIQTLAQGGKIYVFDLASLYITYNNNASLQYFEQTYFNNSPDLVHLNKLGFELLKSCLDIHFSTYSLDR